MRSFVLILCVGAAWCAPVSDKADKQKDGVQYVPVYATSAPSTGPVPEATVAPLHDVPEDLLRDFVKNKKTPKLVKKNKKKLSEGSKSNRKPKNLLLATLEAPTPMMAPSARVPPAPLVETISSLPAPIFYSAELHKAQFEPPSISVGGEGRMFEDEKARRFDHSAIFGYSSFF